MLIPAMRDEVGNRGGYVDPQRLPPDGPVPLPLRDFFLQSPKFQAPFSRCYGLLTGAHAENHRRF